MNTQKNGNVFTHFKNEQRQQLKNYLNIRLRKKVLQGIHNKDENKKLGNMSHRRQKVHGEEIRRWQSEKMGTDRDAQLQDSHGENICERCDDIQYTKICKRCVMEFIIILLRMPMIWKQKHCSGMKEGYKTYELFAHVVSPFPIYENGASL